MDQRNLVSIIRNYPQIWDRSHPLFRCKEAKDEAWETIGSKVGFPGDTCKESFKSIREKYIRERDKSSIQSEKYREWELLTELTFLDPHILPRKQSANSEDLKKMEEFNKQISQEFSKTVSDDFFVNSFNQNDLDKTLISLVKKTTPIWDRNSNTYPNKELKMQLWRNIASTLNLDTNACMLRWKALREKYIRQKTKYQQEGEVKWELLDEMSFLDKVIQYRKKHNDDLTHQHLNALEARMQSKQSDASQESDSNLWQFHSPIDDDSINTVDYIKQENTVFQQADSSYNFRERKRSTSFTSESSERKIKKGDTELGLKSPEQLFGDLVAAMLCKKPEKDRCTYMIEIMTLLSK